MHIFDAGKIEDPIIVTQNEEYVVFSGFDSEKDVFCLCKADKKEMQTLWKTTSKEPFVCGKQSSSDDVAYLQTEGDAVVLCATSHAFANVRIPKALSNELTLDLADMERMVLIWSDNKGCLFEKASGRWKELPKQLIPSLQNGVFFDENKIIINRNDSELYEMQEKGLKSQALQIDQLSLEKYLTSNEMIITKDVFICDENQYWEPIGFCRHDLIGTLLDRGGYSITSQKYGGSKKITGAFNIGILDNEHIWIIDEQGAHISPDCNQPWKHVAIGGDDYDCEALVFYNGSEAIFSGFRDEKECFMHIEISSGKKLYIENECQIWIHNGKCIA